jgi:hypothetical protein
MSPYSHSLGSQIRPEAGVSSGANQIEGYNGECGENRLDKSFAARSTRLGVGSMHAMQELGSCDDGQCQLELPMLLYQQSDIERTALGCNDDAGIDYGSHGGVGIVG